MKIICILTLLTTLGHGGHGTPVVEGTEDFRRDDTITTVKSAQGLEEETTMNTPIQKLQGPDKQARRSILIAALERPREKPKVRRKIDRRWWFKRPQRKTI